MQRTAEIVEQLRVYTNQRIPLLWLGVLATLAGTHGVAAYLVESYWSEHFPVCPWVGIAGALLALAFALYEKVPELLHRAEQRYKREAMGVWNHERGLHQCERIRQAAGVGVLGVVGIYSGFLLAQYRASAADDTRKVLVDLDLATQIQILSNPTSGVLLLLGGGLILGALWYIGDVKEEIRSDLGW